MGVRATAAAAATYSVVVALLDPFTRPAEAAVAAGIGVVVLLAVRAGWHRPHPVGAPPQPAGRAWWLGLAVWLALVAAIGLFQLAVFQSDPRDVYPTLSSMVSEAFGLWPVRAAAVAGWLALGRYLVGRP